jgi:lipid II:glycine glycyltransferase (peptidoglycan interpeptide bridge formation enzyme)
VEVFSRSLETRSAIARVLAELGFNKVGRSRCYRHTLALDLSEPEETIFASFHKKCRRDIRTADRNPVAVRPISDPKWIGRMDVIFRETLSRTGGLYRPQNWNSIIDISKSSPGLSRVIGLFRTDVSGAESLVAFAWASGHGDHWQYASAASIRTDDLKMPMTYCLVWNLIRWARHHGATWFDFGGITKGSARDGRDPLGGISDFKRYFTKNVVEVGEEWVLEPHRFRGALARAISSGAVGVRRLRRRIKPMV